MNKEIVTLIAAIIAAVTSIGNIFLGSWRAIKLEQVKWEQARSDDAQKNLRMAVADFARELATANQRGAWLLWIAVNQADTFSEKDIAAYDAEMNAIYPKLVSSQVLVAANDRETADRLSALANEFYVLEDEIAAANRKFRASREEGLKAMRECHPKTQVYLSRLPGKISEVASIQPRKARN